MLNFEMVQKVNVLYGNGCVGQVGELMGSIGAKKAFIVCDEGVVKAGITQKVIDSIKSAGLDYFVYDKVLSDPPVSIIDAGIDEFNKAGCDLVIGVGGGSSIDTAKGVNILRFNEKPILRYTDFSVEMRLSPNLVVVPTTSGTGSELSDGLIVTAENHWKLPIHAVNSMAQYAVVDPELMTCMPPHLTAITGLDTLAHSVESYTSTLVNHFTGQISEGNIAAVVKWLPIAVKDGSNLEARSHMAVCSAVGGWMLGYAHSNAGHSIATVIGSEFYIPHGLCCAYCVPWVVEFNAPALPEKTQKIGEMLGASFSGNETPEEIGAKTRDAYIAFVDALGIKKATEFAYDRSKFQKLAEDIEGHMLQMFNPRKMTAADALEMLNKMFS